MLFLSLGLILVSGFVIGWCLEKIKIPKVVGMILVGVLLGPSVLNIIDPVIIQISPYLRQLALVIILTRSGLSLNLKNLKKIGRPAILMCVVPAIFEMAAVVIFGPLLLNISIIESLLLGSVLAAVSPAIVVPRMLKLKEEGYGTLKNIPELIMAGSSADDIFVIVLFYAFLGMNQGQSITAWSISQIPLSIIIGVGIGIGLGFLFVLLFKKVKMHKVVKMILFLGISFLFVGLEELVKEYISISALLGIMAMGMIVLLKAKDEAVVLEKGYQKIWSFFEIILFVLVGVSVDIKYVFSAGFMPILVLFIALVFRLIGGFVALLFTELNFKERLFVVLSYIPKATVQASIGGIALSMGLPVGPLVLTVAVLSIIITAPLGAILMDLTYKKLLDKPPLTLDEVLSHNNPPEIESKKENPAHV